jgi:hypothetical protein
MFKDLNRPCLNSQPSNPARPGACHHPPWRRSSGLFAAAQRTEAGQPTATKKQQQTTLAATMNDKVTRKSYNVRIMKRMVRHEEDDETVHRPADIDSPFILASAFFPIRQSKLPPEVNRILYVRNLPYTITAEELYAIFGKYGAVFQIRLGEKDKDTRGTAFVGK